MTVACPNCGQPNAERAEFCANPSCRVFLSWDEGRRPDAEPRPSPPDHRAGARLEMSATHLGVRPGERVTVAVTVHNSGTVVERFRVSVVGDAARWARVEPAEIVAYPAGAATCTVEFAPPLAPPSRAGRHVRGARGVDRASRPANGGRRCGDRGAGQRRRGEALAADVAWWGGRRGFRRPRPSRRSGTRACCRGLGFATGGSVRSQDPAPGTLLDRGSVVTLLVDAG